MVQMRLVSMTFDGALLNRGFWLYVCEVRTRGNRRFFYVGRTGDSSSPHASSPFRRFARHLDDSPHAKANSLHRALTMKNIKPVACRFKVCALGPIFAEARSRSLHRLRRDKIGKLESALAVSLCDSGYRVLGSHSAPGTLSKNQDRLLLELLEQINRKLRMHAKAFDRSI